MKCAMTRTRSPLLATPKTTLRFLSDGGITVRSLKSCLCPLRFFKWWYALNEQRLSLGADLTSIRQTFPNILTAERTEQKRRLRRAVERYRHEQGVLSDPRTEDSPLCFPAT